MSEAPPALATLIAQFEALSPGSVAALAERYAAEAHFVDPFNDVRGRAAVARIYAHMFEQLDAPCFRVTGYFVRAEQTILLWDFNFRFRGQRATQCVKGATHLCFDAAGLICEHIDYWDAAGQLYSRLPLLGALMRWLQRRLATPQ